MGHIHYICHIMRTTFISAFLTAVAAIAVISCSPEADDYGYRIKDGKIVYNTPARPADQQCMLEFRCDPIDTVRVGFVGLGMRGPSAVYRFTFIDGTRTVALCDLIPERVEKAQDILVNAGKPRAAEYSGEEGYKQLCERDDIDLVYLAVPWQLHTTIAVYAMEHGKHVAIEVPAATNIAECWALVNTAERTRRHCMMLENCIYDDFELTSLNMAQNGVFGEIVHVEGAYIHNLDPFWDHYQGDWRMEFNKKHRGDVYPTHGLGPAANVLNIHRGDKMDYLVAMDSDSFHGKDLSEKRYGDREYANGDHTGTLIRTHNGKTIEIQHDTYNPRPYSRMYQITGTEGFCNKYPNNGFAVESSKVDSSLEYDNLDAERYVSEEVRDALMKQYQHPITKENSLLQTAKKVGGHGGMDFIMDYRLIYCLHNGLPLDQDVYDAAEWSCLTELTEVSILNGSMPVIMPDFTRGDWDKVKGVKFAL